MAVDNSDTLKLEIELLEKQEAFVFSQVQFPLFLGGVGGGKTWGGAVKAMLKVLEFPEVPGLICANTYSQLADATIKVFKAVLDYYGIRYWHKEQRNNIYIPVGGVLAEIHCRSLDKFEHRRGTEYGWAWLDEARDMKEEAFHVVLARLRYPHIDVRQLWITTTPFGFNWIYKKFIKNPIKGSEVFVSGTHDNYFLPDDYVEALLDSFDDRLAKQEVYAEILDISKGQLYHQFDRNIHVKDDLEYDKYLPLIHSWDFNVDPFCTVVMQVHGSEVHIIDEIVIRDASVENIVTELKRRYPPKKHESIYCLYGDATGRQRTLTKNNLTTWDLVNLALMEVETSLGNYKVENSVISANPSVYARNNAVNMMFKNAKGKIRLYIDQKCDYTITDCEQAVKKEGSQEPDKKAGTDLYHCMEAVGYFIEYNYPVGGRTAFMNASRKG